MRCNPTVTVTHGTQPMTALEFRQAANAVAGIIKTALPQQIVDAVFKIIAARGVEPREGFVANELSVPLCGGVEVSVEGRGRGKGVAIVRHHGEVVAHGFSGTFIPGAWQRELSVALEGIWQDEQEAKADKNCQPCKGYGVRLNEGEWLACECTERSAQTSFAVIHGANQQQVFINDVAERLAA